MFDFEKEESTPMSEFEWDGITKAHAEQEHDASRDAAMKNQGKREAFQDFYRDRRRHRKDRVAVAATRYGLLCVGLTAVGWLVRSIPWLAITLGCIALVFGMISAVGIGKYSEM
jgi:hypothetical protein